MPGGSISVFFQSSCQKPSIDSAEVGATDAETSGTGSSASRSSAPGVRSLVTSKGLTTLTPFWMKVLSPQLSTWLPSRRSTGVSPASNAPVT